MPVSELLSSLFTNFTHESVKTRWLLVSPEFCYFHRDPPPTDPDTRKHFICAHNIDGCRVKGASVSMVQFDMTKDHIFFTAGLNGYHFQWCFRNGVFGLRRVCTPDLIQPSYLMETIFGKGVAHNISCIFPDSRDVFCYESKDPQGFMIKQDVNGVACGGCRSKFIYHDVILGTFKAHEYTFTWSIEAVNNPNNPNDPNDLNIVLLCNS